MGSFKENTPIPVEVGGGKLEGVKALEQAGFPVPKSRYLYHGDLTNPKLLEACFADLAKPLIVRGSHPNDWHGYIDVLPTYKNIRSDAQLEESFRNIQRAAASDALRQHASDWDQSFSPEVHILVQEQSPSPVSGSMLRHPHILGRIDMNFVDRVKHAQRGVLQSPPAFSYAIKRTSGKLDYGLSGVDVTQQEIEYAMRVYGDVETSGLLDNGWVYQMEIGLSPFFIYQLRPFKRKEPARNFKIPNITDLKGPYIFSSLTFGITPPEGIGLNFAVHTFEDVAKGELNPPKGKYGLLLVSETQNSLATGMRIGDLSVFHTMRGLGSAYLEHGDYRFLKKAEYASSYYSADDFSDKDKRFRDPEDYVVFKNARYWSNGRESILVHEQSAA